MKSNIMFGKNGEANSQLLANRNGHHHLNEKSGSVSSASSSVSSSTENLKMNGGYKLVLINMSSKSGEVCTQSERISSDSGSANSRPLNNDQSCDNRSLSARSKQSAKIDVGAGDVASQTRRDSGCNPENPNSLTKSSPPIDKKEPLGVCTERLSLTSTHRNPITGLGLGEDGVGGIKPKKPKSRRDGNPVTGEGYKPGNDLNSSVPSLNGTNQVINKNRIPPGGFSSGLW